MQRRFTGKTTDGRSNKQQESERTSLQQPDCEISSLSGFHLLIYQAGCFNLLRDFATGNNKLNLLFLLTLTGVPIIPSSVKSCHKEK